MGLKKTLVPLLEGWAALMLDWLKGARIGPVKIEYSQDEARGAPKSIEVLLYAAWKSEGAEEK